MGDRASGIINLDDVEDAVDNSGLDPDGISGIIHPPLTVCLCTHRIPWTAIIAAFVSISRI